MNKTALDRFFLNTSTPAERTEVIAWMLDPANDLVLKSWMKENWNLLDTTMENQEEPDVELIWGRLQVSLRKEAAHQEPAPEPIAVIPSRNRKLFRYIAAACLVALLATGAYLFLTPQLPDNGLSGYGNELVREENNSSATRRILLEDGSSVVLAPHTTLQYPKHFLKDTREVALTGEAFFDIAKGAGHPFLIYANNIVTRVLGTSFTIHAAKGDEQVTVSVHTGRVQVLERKALEEAGKGQKITNGVILTANQKAVYIKEKNDFQTTLVDTPLLINAPAAGKLLFDFKRVKLPVLMAALEKAYGIEIILETERLNTCIFSGDLTEESLYEKLDLVCKSVNAVYEISGTRILIKGEGCN